MSARATDTASGPGGRQAASACRKAWAAGIRYGGASLASVALAAVAAKLVAVTGGPAATGLIANLQQLRQTGVVLSTLNGQTALVQGGAAAPAGERALFYRSALAMVAGGTFLTGLLLAWALPFWKAAGAGFSTHGPQVALLVALSAGSVCIAAWRNAAGAWREVACLQLAAPATLAAWLAAGGFGPADANPDGALRLLTAAAAVGFGLAGGVAWKSRAELSGGTRLFQGRYAVQFLSVAGVMAGTSAFASFALLHVRSGMAAAGWRESGLFDAAWAVSMNTMGLVLAGIQGFYLPALAVAPAAERREMIGGTLAFVVAVVLPVVTALICFKPLVLEWLYAASYAGAAQTLRWTLLGDYLKATGWVLAMPMLACRHLRAFCLTDLGAYGAFAAVWHVLQPPLGPREAGGIAFVAMYAVHLAAAATYAWRAQGFRLAPRTAALWLGGAAIVGGASAQNWDRPDVDPASAAAWCLAALAMSAGFTAGEFRTAGGVQQCSES